MNILFVCTGNTCRSPMAESYLKSKNLPDVYVESRGISAPESPVSKNSVTVMAEIGIDIADYKSEQLQLSDISLADKIICMSPSHLTVLSLYANKEKLYLLGDGISDPYGGDTEVYRKCRDEIIKAIDALISEGFFTEVLIAEMKEEHIKAIAGLEKICFSEPWSEKSISESFLNGTKFFVALNGKNVLGYIGISCVLDEGYITNIAVFPQFRKKGVGERLLERVCSYAKDTGLSFVSLEVRMSNTPAISLYEKSGFKTEGKRRGFYRNPNEDAIIMTKRF